MTAKRATYLDWNANAPMRAEAIEAVARALALCGNPSSVHRFGRRARQALEAARETVAELVNAAAEDVLFTSGGTEANSLALKA
ncbi:MAG: aminotransferase class V-fold PLP-dependent enzyme, partial [Stellaceae bacterium]